MSAPDNVIPLSPADLALYEAFRVAEIAADGARPLAEEMLAAVDYESDRLGTSLRLAHKEYGAPFCPAAMRRYVVLRYVSDLLERVAANKGQVAPILYPELTQRQRRRA